MRPSFALDEALKTLGLNLKNARLRRALPQSVIAERAGISLNTLSKIENGDPGVSIGNVASVVHALGITSAISTLASSENDPIGLANEARYLPRRVRAKKSE